MSFEKEGATGKESPGVTGKSRSAFDCSHASTVLILSAWETAKKHHPTDADPDPAGNLPLAQQHHCFAEGGFLRRGIAGA